MSPRPSIASSAIRPSTCCTSTTSRVVAGRRRLVDADRHVLADSRPSGYYFANQPAGPKVAFTPDGSGLVALKFDDQNGSASVVVLDAATLTPVSGDPGSVGIGARAIAVGPDAQQ